MILGHNWSNQHQSSEDVCIIRVHFALQKKRKQTAYLQGICIKVVFFKFYDDLHSHV